MDWLNMSKNKPSLSIVVPVYNTEQYLVQCLESLVNQTLKDIELILVDDGSTDGSSEICRKYASEYSFVKLIRQKNSGVTRALMAGMTEVTGEYYSFCGSDDFVALDFYEKLFNAAIEKNADIVQCDYSMYYSEDDIVPCLERLTAKAVERSENNAAHIMDVLLFSPSLTVRRIHRTALTKEYNIEFDPDIRIGEDLFFSCCTLLVCKKVVYVQQSGYFYRQNRDGRLSFIGDDRIMDLFTIFDKLDDFIHRNKLKKTSSLSHLAINIPLHQLYRVDEKLRAQYLDELTKRITLKNFVLYVVSGFVFSIKAHFVKYFVLNLICTHTLLVACIFRKVKPISHSMLKLTLFFRKGGFVKKFLQRGAKNAC